jgi:hypothetical protein
MTGVSERAHPALGHLPHVGRNVTIEITDYLRSGKTHLEVLYHGSKSGARRSFHGFLRKHHDRGKSYVVRYVRLSK